MSKRRLDEHLGKDNYFIDSMISRPNVLPDTEVKEPLTIEERDWIRKNMTNECIGIYMHKLSHFYINKEQEKEDLRQDALLLLEGALNRYDKSRLPNMGEKDTEAATGSKTLKFYFHYFYGLEVQSILCRYLNRINKRKVYAKRHSVEVNLTFEQDIFHEKEIKELLNEVFSRIKASKEDITILLLLIEGNTKKEAAQILNIEEDRVIKRMGCVRSQIDRYNFRSNTYLMTKVKMLLK